jgi:hypothetical protein
MTVTELYEAMESNYRSGIPWPWPRNMNAFELEFVASLLPDLDVKHGALIGDEAVIYGLVDGRLLHGKLPWRRMMDSIHVYSGSIDEVVGDIEAGRGKTAYELTRRMAG